MEPKGQILSQTNLRKLNASKQSCQRYIISQEEAGRCIYRLARIGTLSTRFLVHTKGDGFNLPS